MAAWTMFRLPGAIYITEVQGSGIVHFCLIVHFSLRTRQHSAAQAYPCIRPTFFATYAVMARLQPSINVVGLLELIPPLLDRCLLSDDNLCKKHHTSIPKLLSLRLVNKEASRIALLALRKYRLRLEGVENNSNLMGTRLLHQTQLKKLLVCAPCDVW